MLTKPLIHTEDKNYNNESMLPPRKLRLYAGRAIILNMITCPMTVFVNLLVIIAVKTKRRLQNSYNILLACLAATDLVVGAIVQPSFIVGEMFLITANKQINKKAHTRIFEPDIDSFYWKQNF